MVWTGYDFDLYQFDPATATWNMLSGLINGLMPAVRVHHGMLPMKNAIFIYGGFSKYAVGGDERLLQPCL